MPPVSIPEPIGEQAITPIRSCSAKGRQFSRVRVGVRERPQCELQHDHRMHETLLCTVVPIALDPPPALVTGRDDPPARRRQSSATLRVGNRHRHQFREIGEPRLRVRRQRLLSRRTGADCTPQAALHDDRCRH
jgi:hypothetical protein